MKVVLEDGKVLDLPGVSLNAVVEHFGPFSKDGYSVADVRLRMKEDVVMWAGPRAEFEEHLKEIIETVQEVEKEVSEEVRYLTAVEDMAVAMMIVGVEFMRFNDSRYRAEIRETGKKMDAEEEHMRERRG